MATKKPRFTTVFHEGRIAAGLTMNEYCILDSIHKLQGITSGRNAGWCVAKRKYFAEFIGIAPRNITNILGKLAKGEWLEFRAGYNNNHKKVTQKWVNEILLYDDSKTVKEDKKGTNHPPRVDESSIPSYTYTYKVVGDKCNSIINAYKSITKIRIRIPDAGIQETEHYKRLVKLLEAYPDLTENDFKRVFEYGANEIKADVSKKRFYRLDYILKPENFIRQLELVDNSIEHNTAPQSCGTLREYYKQVLTDRKYKRLDEKGIITKREKLYIDNKSEILKVWRKDYSSQDKIPPFLLFELLYEGLTMEIVGTTPGSRNVSLKAKFEQSAKYKKTVREVRQSFTQKT